MLTQDHPLSLDLARLSAQAPAQGIRLGDVFQALHVHGYPATLFFLALPFTCPVSLPGISSVFGLIIAWMGMRMALGRSPALLPARLGDRRLPQRVIPVVLKAAGRVFGFLERLLRPRFLYPKFPETFRRTAGAVVAVSGLLLLLPLPIPLSNTFPAVTVLLLAVADLKKDGALFAAGCLQFLLCLGFFGLLLLGGTELYQRITT
ncbi:MAG: exopolysaccharide biosynthesis protein [Verrucomicrobiales bacterium]|nr:exopolysaccharide biosynthesis protein [Verrucomicrobiales bacterium]